MSISYIVSLMLTSTPPPERLQSINNNNILFHYTVYIWHTFVCIQISSNGLNENTNIFGNTYTLQVHFDSLYSSS